MKSLQCLLFILIVCGSPTVSTPLTKTDKSKGLGLVKRSPGYEDEAPSPEEKGWQRLGSVMDRKYRAQTGLSKEIWQAPNGTVVYPKGYDKDDTPIPGVVRGSTSQGRKIEKATTGANTSRNPQLQSALEVQRERLEYIEAYERQRNTTSRGNPNSRGQPLENDYAGERPGPAYGNQPVRGSANRNTTTTGAYTNRTRTEDYRPRGYTEGWNINSTNPELNPRYWAGPQSRKRLEKEWARAAQLRDAGLDE